MTADAPAAGPPGRAADAWLLAHVPLFFFAFPERFGDTVVDAGPVLAPLAVAALILGVRGRRPRRAAGAAFLAAWLAHAAILHWVYVVTVRYGGATPAIGVAAVAAIALYPAAVTAGVGAAIGWLDRGGRATPLALALAFAVGDHLRTFLGSGFPWSLLGTTQVADPLLLPLARFGGVHLVGFAVALGGALLAAGYDVLRSRPRGRAGLRAGALAWVALAVFAVMAGGRADRAPAPGRTLRVAALQGSVDQGLKWREDGYASTVERYAVLTRSAVAAGASLVVWPETAVPGALELDGVSARRIESLARSTGAALVIGAVGVGVDVERRRVSDWYDSAFVIGPDGGLVDRYDKSHLVPFGEYLPLRALLGRFFEAIARGIAQGDVSAGAGPRAIDLVVVGGSDEPARRVRIGAPICYELLFPDLVRRFARDGAELLVAITNDGWYGRTGAPDQFLAITAMRAAETGLPLVRAANTGVSALIDGRGRIREASGLFERGYVIGDVSFGGGDGPTFYARHGDAFAWACQAALGVALVVSGRRAGRGAGPTSEGS